MIVTTLKRTEKVNPLDQIKPVNKLDDLQDLEVQDSNVKKALMAYESALDNKIPINSVRRSQIDDTRHKFNFFRDTYKTVLLPDEITIFEKIATKYAGHRNFSEHTGFFLSALIKNSYDAGNNNFNFETNKIEGLGTSINGSEENPIIMNIGKNYGDEVGYEARHSTFIIKENYGASLGSGAKHSTFNIKENSGDQVGSRAEHSTIKIQTNNGGHVGSEALDSRINIKKNHGSYCGLKAEHSTLIIKENSGELTGGLAKHSTIKIQTNNGGRVGTGAKHSTIKIQTNNGREVGTGANDSTFNIKENYEGSCGENFFKNNYSNDVKNCIFKSSNKETLESAFKYAKPKLNNKFYLIQPNGEEIPYKDKEIQDSNVKKALMAYESALYNDIPINSVRRSQIDDTRHKFNFFRDTYKTVLLPDEITIFKNKAWKYKGHRNFREHTGLFLSALIKNSYDAGNNNFNFETNHMEGLGTSIKGSEENPIVMSIGSNYEEKVGVCARHSTFNIKENHGASLGSDARHSTFNIEKNHGFYVGDYADNCTFNIKENHGERVAEYSKNSTIDLKKNHGERVGEHAENCIFKSPDKKTLNSIIANPEYNHFNLIQPNGEEIPYEK